MDVYNIGRNNNNSYSNYQGPYNNWNNNNREDFIYNKPNNRRTPKYKEFTTSSKENYNYIRLLTEINKIYKNLFKT